MANVKRRLRSEGVSLRSGFPSEMYLTARSIHSSRGMLVNKLPRELRSRVIYKFTCACCNACYIGETGRHFSTRVREHLSSDKSSHIFKHLLSSERCRQSCSTDCFEILDSAPTKFQLKLKEAMHINWEKPNLNQQVHHVNLTLTL